MSAAELQMDEALRPLVRATDELELQSSLMRIVSEHAAPIIKDIIRYKLRPHEHASNRGRDQGNDAEDVYNDAIVQLLARLREFRAQPQQKGISNLRSYVAVIAYNSCYRHLRRIYPQRHILKNRLRYLMTRQAGFALWEGANKDLICGFEVWQNDRAKRVESERIQQLNDDPAIAIDASLVNAGVENARIAQVVAAIFSYADCPLKLDELVNFVARLFGIKDHESSLDDEDVARGIADKQADFANDYDRQEYLKKLWAEILALPERQRAALLLNMRDGDGRGCIELFQLTGVATLKQIAKTLDVSREQFVVLWNELPLDDLTIAERLGLSRQQVINLRKSARERLARRMKNY